MSGQLKEYRVRIYDSDDSTVVATYTGEVAKPPTYGAQIIRPLRARTENNPFDIEIVDANESVTADLYDADGAFQLRGRLADVSERLDGGAWTVTYTGRIVDVEQSESVLSYVFRITDERWIEREHDLFVEADTTSIVPMGVKASSGGFPNASHVTVEPVGATVDDTQYADVTRVRLDEPERVSESVVKYLLDDQLQGVTGESVDLSSGEGVFDHVRLEVDGTNYEIVSFVENWNLGNVAYPVFPKEFRRPELGEDTKVRWVWVADPGNVLGVEGTAHDVMVHAPTAPPSDVTPLHIGRQDPDGILLNNKGGVHPFQLLKDIYDGGYSEDGVSVRYDSAAMNALIADDSYPHVNFRITEVKKTARWLEDNIYQVFRVVPFINDAGEVSPKSVALPTADAIDVTSLPTIDASNLSSVPSLVFSGADAVTSIKFDWPIIHPGTSISEGDRSADRLAGIERSPAYIKEHATASGKGGGEKISIPLNGIIPEYVGPPDTGFLAGAHPDNVADEIAADIFALFGDGPQIGSFHTLSSTESPDTEPGKIVKLDLGTHPNGVTGTRGGARLVQILTRTREPSGFAYDYLDIGPDLQPIAEPTVTVTKSASDGYNTVDISISGIPADGSVVVQGSTDQAQWFPIAGDTTQTSITYPKVPSGTTFYVRARAKQPGRVSSDWSVVDSAIMDTLSAPANLASSQDGNAVELTWTNPAHPGHDIMPVWDDPGSLTSYLKEPIPPGSTRFAFNHLDAGGHTIGVKYIDAFGGESPAATVAVTINTTDQLPEPQKLALIQADQDGIRLPTPDEKYVVGTGLEISFEPQARYANVEVQVADSSDFTNDLVKSEIVPPGVYRHKILDLPMKSDPNPDELSGPEDYYVRVRSVKKGYPSSAWSSVVSGEATRLLNDAGPDLFAGGFAFLDVEPDGDVLLLAGTSDPDTDKVVYQAVKNTLNDPPFPDPNTLDVENDQVIEDTQLPYHDVLNDGGGNPITVADGDTVHVTIGFWNDVAKTYGQFTQDVHRVTVDDLVRAFPIVDVDGKDVKLFPRRSASSNSVKWVVDTSDAPTLAEVQAGTVSTADEITVHTFGQHGEEIWVGMLAYANDDGTGLEVGEGGTSGPATPFILKAKYTAQNEVPTLIWAPRVFPQPGNERIQLAAWDDQDQVGIKYRVFDEGSHPGFTLWDSDTTLVADPVIVEVDVPIPGESGPDKVLEAIAYDSDGNQSHPNDKPLRIHVDGNKIPSGDIEVDVDPSTGKVYATVTRDDSDTGSYRFKVNVGDPETGGYVSVDFTDTDEFSGTDFGARNYLGASYDLAAGQSIWVECEFFRTTTTTTAGQNGALQSTEPTRAAESRAPDSLPPSLRVTTEQIVDATTGRFGVTVEDPDALATALDVRTKVGDQAWSGWSDDTGGSGPSDGVEYTEDVTRVKGLPSYVEYRLSYSLKGNSYTRHQKSSGFQGTPDPTGSVTPFVDKAAKTATCALDGDTFTAKWKVLAQTGSFPSLASVQAEVAISGKNLSPDDVGTLVSGLVDGDVIYYSALPIASDDTEGDLIQVKQDYSEAQSVLVARVTDYRWKGVNDQFTGGNWYLDVALEVADQVQSIDITVDDGTSTITSYNHNISGSGTHRIQNSGETAAETFGYTSGPFTVTILAYTGTGGTGSTGQQTSTNVASPDAQGGFTNELLLSGKVRLPPALEADYSAASSLVERGARSTGFTSGTNALDYSIGPVQTMTLSGNVTISGVNNFDGPSLILRVDTSSSTISFDGTAFEGVNNILSSGNGTVSIAILNFGTSKHFVAFAESVS